MTRNRTCGQYPTATGYDPYCPVCTRLFDLAEQWGDDDRGDAEPAYWEPIYAQADRVTHLHQAYRRRHH